MNKEQLLIHYRNQLMVKLLWLSLGLCVLVNSILFPYILPVVVPTGLVVCLVTSFLVWKKFNVEWTMYIIIICIFSFFFILIIMDPILVNFIFVLYILVFSSLYKGHRPILLASALTIFFTVYCFYTFTEEIFPNSHPLDIVYYIMLITLLTIFLIYSGRITESFRLKAEMDEKKTAEELSMTKEYLESFITHTTDAIIVHDINGKVIIVNNAFQSLYGWSEEEILSEHVPVILEKDISKIEELWKLVEQGGNISNLEMVTKHKDGSLVDISATLSPIRDTCGKVIAIASIIRNITEQKKTEEFIRVSEKLSVAGQLAAGVAHEIRNPLAVISGYIQLLQKKDQGNDRKYTIMLSELNRINLIISEFLMLSKPNVIKFEKNDIKNIVEEVVALINTQAIMKNISIKSHLETLPPIDCEPNQIKQVLINLLKNSIEAMPNSGEISVEIKNKDNHHFTITINDQGVGIPEEKIRRVGEPFFTTKEKGTGLGLMVSYKIIENHQGKMEFNSKVNEGTRVVITLPMSLKKDEHIEERSIS